MKRVVGVLLLMAVVLLVAGWLLFPRLVEWKYLMSHGLNTSQVLPGEGAITPENAAQLRLIEQRGWGSIYDVTWAPDSRSLAMATTTGIRLVDAGSLNAQSEITAEAPVRAVAFSPDGSLLAGAVQGKGVAIWRVASTSFERLLEVPSAGQYDWVSELHFSNDGRWVAVTWLRILYVWEVQSGRLQVLLRPQEPELQIPMLLGFLPGQTKLLYADNVRLYTLDVETGAIAWAAPFTRRSDNIWAVNAPGDQMALGGCSQLKLFDAGQEIPRFTLLVDESCLKQVVFSTDGQRLAVLSALGAIYLISQDGSVFPLDRGGQPANNTWTNIPLRFSPDGQFLAWVAAPWSLLLYRTADGSLAHTLRNPMAAIQAVHIEAGDQGLMILNEGDQVSLVQITPEKTLATWKGDTTYAINYSPQAGFSADGSLVWLMHGSRCLLRETETGAIYGVPLSCGEKMALSPDGDRWAIANLLGLSEDPSRVVVFRTEDGEQLHSFKTQAYYWRSLQFSSDGQLLLAVGDVGETYLWAGGQRVFPWISGLGWRTVFTPDGLGLASGSMIASLSGREEIMLPDGQQSQVAISPDGRLIARRLEDGSIELWDMTQVKLLHSLSYFPGHQAILAFSADGRRLVVVLDGVMAFWGVK